MCAGPEGGRQRLVTIRGLDETGATGNRYGDAVGHACLGVGGPVTRTATVEIGHGGRVSRMREFGARPLSLLSECREVARPKP